MTVALAFLATAISTVLAQAMLKRYTTRRRPYEGAWAAALAMFAIASAALAVGVSTGWNSGVFRIFYLFGGVLNVAWLALGTVYLQLGRAWGRRVQWGLVFYSGVALGSVLTSPLAETVSGTAIPSGRDLFGALPRILAAAGSGLGATVVIVGAVWSSIQLARLRTPGSARLALGTALIAIGTLITASKGIFEAVLPDGDDAFVFALTLGIAVIASGFAVTTAKSKVTPTATPSPGDPVAATSR